MSFDPSNPRLLELGVISSVLIDPDQMRLPEVRALRPEHLHHLSGIWSLIRKVSEAGEDVSIVTLAQHMTDPLWPSSMTLTDLIGLDTYALRPQELPGAVLGILNAYRRTEARGVAVELARQLTDEGTDQTGAIGAAHGRLGQLMGGTLKDTTEAISDDLGTALDRILNPGRHQGPTTGLSSLDRVLGGWQPRTLNVLAGRPSMGKSLLAAQFAQAAAQGGPSDPARVLMFSLEDGKTITRTRALARLSGVEIRNDRPPSPGAEARLREGAQKLERLSQHWLIDEEHRLDQIIAACWRQHAVSPLGLVIVDQLSHIVVEQGSGRADNRTQLYGHVTKELKRQVAQRLGVPVILVSQLSRENTRRSNMAPELTDLRDSGEIEQDADTVTMIHRPDYYDPADQPGKAELLVRKNRNGPTKAVTVSCNMQVFKFYENGQ